MSKDICIGCKRVISTTSDQNCFHGINVTGALDHMEAFRCGFAAKEKLRKDRNLIHICICDDCLEWNEVGLLKNL